MNVAIQKELETIRKRHNGLLRPADVVEFAKDKATALHGQFTWDDGKAAEEYRLWQARMIIRVTVSVMPKVEKECRAYVSLMNDRQRDGGGYRSMVSVLSDAERREALLQEALAELNVFRRKYALLKELAPVFAAIDEIGVVGIEKRNGRQGKKTRELVPV